ncbi:plasmid partitioning/stability family protein [Escherichia coli]|uniref:plasmid partitioning/stability family protein n=1 Tax=Escherichia coli TaxID=562 RepID=UPI000C1C75EB|nr:plasmid partitioning/stability family protein [Escherichia coli]
MTTPTRRISFYLKPDAVKSEQEACNYLDSLPASERSRAQRAAFLAGLALIKRNPAFAYWMAEWPEDNLPFNTISTKETYQDNPPSGIECNFYKIKKNIQTLFPE